MMVSKDVKSISFFCFVVVVSLMYYKYNIQWTFIYMWYICFIIYFKQFIKHLQYISLLLLAKHPLWWQQIDEGQAETIMFNNIISNVIISTSAIPIFVFSPGITLYFWKNFIKNIFIERKAYLVPERGKSMVKKAHSHIKHKPGHALGPCPNIMKANLLGLLSGLKFSGSKLSGFMKFFLLLTKWLK